jgi:hypothetical protein
MAPRVNATLGKLSAPHADSHWMNTMYRCALAAFAAAVLIAPAAAQVQRNFPANALRGSIVIGEPPEITLNGRAARLAPGARIRGQDNMIQMSASLAGQRLLVNYTIDTLGLVYDVWILRPEEAAIRPWPTTPEQLATWTFDPVAQTWAKP